MEQKFSLRTEHNIRTEKQVKGFKGLSGLIHLKGFSFAQSMEPEYMHGILLGITKVLLNKWCSSSESGQLYFIGKNLQAISKRLQLIKCPDYVEWLLRDLENYYTHLKATELQIFLLFYYYPCLKITFLLNI